MVRNLDLTSLRSFVTIADVGGVTRAATVLNLSQTAVSMEIIRPGQMLGTELLDRSARTQGPQGGRRLSGQDDPARQCREAGP